VPIFIERFVLPVFAAVVVLLAITNPMGFDKIQRVTGSMILILAAFFLAHTIYKPPTLEKPGTSTQSNPKPPVQEEGYLIMSGIEVFPEYSILSAGKRIKFRVTFTNSGSRPVDDTRMIVGINISWEILSRDMEIEAARNFRGWINSRLEQDKLLKGPQIAPGNSPYSDIISEPLEPRQVKAVLAGTGHIRLYIWARWKTEDGNNPEIGHCVRLITPKSKQIVQAKGTDWEVCPFI
jgi:hypothetical protein